MAKDATAYVRGLIVVLMATVAVFSIMGGVGTVCVAWSAASWPPFRALAEYSAFYKATVFINLGVGFAAAIITYAFIRAEKWAYKAAIWTLAIGAGSGLIKMYVSNMLRGATSPTEVRVYVTIAVLVIMLIIRLPFIWNKIDLTRSDGKSGSYGIPTGMACMAAGLGLLGTPYIAGPSHTYDGVNYVNYLLPELYIIGGIFLGVGVGLLTLVKLGVNIDGWVANLGKSLYKWLVPSARAEEVK